MRSRETSQCVFDSNRLAVPEEIIAKNFPKPIINTSQSFKKYFEPQGEKYKENHTSVPHNGTMKTEDKTP